jgi:hypothetical protein
VVSNRVHALVLGITEGAVPMAPAEWGSDKAERIFSAAGISGTTVDGAEQIDEIALARIELRCFEQLARARARLDRSAGDLATALRSHCTSSAPSVRRVLEPRRPARTGHDDRSGPAQHLMRTWSA